MSHLRPDAVLFDLDGTLVNTLALWVDVFLRQLEAWGVRGYTEAHYFEQVFARKPALPDVLEDVGIGRKHTTRFREARDAAYVVRLGEEASWIDAAEHVLEMLGARLPLGIVTQSRRTYFDAVDQRLGLGCHVQAVVTHTETRARGKPDPYGLLLASESLQVEPARCAYVGDQPSDVDAAQRAGMTSVLIHHARTRSMPDRSAHHVLDSIDAVPGVLGLDDRPRPSTPS